MWRWIGVELVRVGFGAGSLRRCPVPRKTKSNPALNAGHRYIETSGASEPGKLMPGPSSMSNTGPKPVTRGRSAIILTLCLGASTLGLRWERGWQLLDS